MLRATFLTLLAAALSFNLAGQPSPSPNLVLRVSTPTHFADGQVLGATSAGFPVQMNQPIVLYAYSGRTLCLSRSPRPGLPSDAGYGWRLQILPLRNANGLVLQVEWQRMWDRGDMLGVNLSAATRATAELTLHPGGQVLLDYLSAVNRTTTGSATEATPAAPAPACPALGMGLEVGLQPVEGPALVEANLWLVRTMPDGTERSQRQTVRASLGSTAEYYFDDVMVAVTPSTGRSGPPSAERSVHTFGRISPIKIEDGKVRLDLTIAQELSAKEPLPAHYGAGSSTFPLTAGPDEVLSFQVPTTVVDGGVGERLAVRVQVRQIR